METLHIYHTTPFLEYYSILICYRVTYIIEPEVTRIGIIIKIDNFTPYQETKFHIDVSFGFS